MSNIITPALKATAQRSPAERALISAFERAADTLPGGGWVARVRGEAMRWFETNGLPTRRLEAFKYTDLRERLKDAFAPALSTDAPTAASTAEIDIALGPLAALDADRLVFVDGEFQPALSRVDGLGECAEQMPLAPLLKKAPPWLEGKFVAGRLGETNALTALNTAFMSDGLMLKIKPGKSATRPVVIVTARAGPQPRSVTTRNVIAMEAGARLTLIEAHVTLPGAAPQGLSNTVTDVTVADGAQLAHIKCALEGPGSAHLSSWIVKVGANAGYRGFQLTAGVGLARSDILVEMAGAGSRLDLSGAFLARGTSHVDTTLVVDHKVSGCESRELFKCVLGDRARGVFQGKIIVRPGADGTDGKQMARALLLSDEAEFDSKPELEIYADDVACGHGATAAALDDDLLFYCRSRGIPETEARALLIEAFIGEAIDKVEDDAVQATLRDVARLWLAAKGA